MSASPSESLIGVLVGERYRLIRCVQSSETVGVYEAYQDNTQRKVSLTLIRASLPSDSDVVTRFHKRIATCRQLHHPNILRVLDGGHDPRGLYVVNKQVTGQSVAERLREVGSLHPREAGAIALSVARGLAEAHRLGLVHAGVRPTTVVLHERGPGEKEVKLLNLASSYFLFAEHQYADASGEVPHARVERMASLSYAPKEQREFGTLDGRSDLYALGALSFEMLSAEPPFDGLVDGATGLPALPPGTPYGFRELLRSLLSEAKSDRPQHADDVLVPLNEITGGYRLGHEVPDGAGAGRGVVPRINEPRGHRGSVPDEMYRRSLKRELRGTASSDETSQERRHRIEQSLASPLETPKSEPFGVMALGIVLIGLVVWWFIYVGT